MPPQRHYPPSTLEELAPDFPQLREELLGDRFLQVLGAERAARPGRERPDDALDELDVQKTPQCEPLLVLEQPLRQHLKRTLMRLRVDLFQRHVVRYQQIVVELLQRRLLEGFHDQLRNLAVLLEHPEKMLLAHSRDRLDRAELHALR